MFKNVFGDKLVTNLMFDSDFTDNPRLPSPYQLQNKILIKNRKMTFEPSIGLLVDTSTNIINTKQDRCLSDSSIDDDELDEFLDNPESEDEVEECTDAEIRVPAIRMSPRRTSSVNSFISARTNVKNRRNKNKKQGSVAHLSDYKTDEEFVPNVQSTRRHVGQVGQIAPELSEIVIYTQAVKFKAHMKNFINDSLDFKCEAEQRNISSSFITKTNLLSGTSLKRQKSSSQLSIHSLRSAEENSITPSSITMNNINLNADCWKTTSLHETFCRRLLKKNPRQCINYSKKHIVRVYPSGMRIDSSNFNPLNFWQFGMQVCLF